jgi:cellulose biosynthesis protein BcsQ
MEEQTKRPLALVAFLSGKGGAGKTTAAIGVAKIMADVGFKVLLVDFDLATSGASYFFAPKFLDWAGNGLAGTLDLLPTLSQEAAAEGFKRLVLPISENFDFIPSRTALGKPSSPWKGPGTKEFFVSTMLRPMLGSLGGSYDFVLIDNQAGYTTTTAAGAAVATKAVVVAESDRISSDAVDNLIALLGNDMPRFRRYLINKVEIRESGDYRSKVEAFKAMNRLPPLPFDFSVRNAFGDREIPVDVEKPTSFLIALFATVKEIFPEQKQHLEQYETDKVTRLFDRYQQSLDELLAKRQRVQDEIVEFQTLEKRDEYQSRIFNSRLQVIVLMMTSLVGVTFVARDALARWFAVRLGGEDFVMGVLVPTLVVGIGAIAWLLVGRSNRLSETAKVELRRTRDLLKLQRELSDIESEVGRYKNLIATRSRDLLVDFERAPRVPPA